MRSRTTAPWFRFEEAADADDGARVERPELDGMKTPDEVDRLVDDDMVAIGTRVVMVVGCDE